MTTDIAELVAHQFPGIVIQKNLVDAIAVWLADHDGVFLETDVPAVLAQANAIVPDTQRPWLPTAQNNYGPVPWPSGLPRFPDSNPASDNRGEILPATGWSILDAEKARCASVHGGAPAHREPG